MVEIAGARVLEERRLRQLIEVGRSLVSELNPEAVLYRVLDAARDLTGARYAALGILDEGRDELERFLFRGIDEQTRTAIGPLPRGRGVLGELIRNPKPLRLPSVGDHPRSYGFPPGHPPMGNFLGVPLLIRGEAYGNLYLTEKVGDFDAGDEEAVVILADWAAVAIENARLYRRVESRRDELERAVRALEATTAIARAVGGETDLDRVLELIVKRGRALVEARSLVVLLSEGDEVVAAAAAGEVGEWIVGARLPMADSIAGQVLRTGRPERFSQDAPPLRYGLGELGLSALAGLVVPLTFRGQRLGVLEAVDRLVDGPRFSEDDEQLMLAFAASAATAVATAKSVAEERLEQSIASAEEERGRWARELHDETLQGLGALRVLLSSALRRGSVHAFEPAVRQAVHELGGEIDKLRRLIADLRPASLDEIGLEAALRDLAERSSANHGLRVETDIDLAWEQGRAGSRLLPELESTIYRVVQESITNAGKHARVDRALIGVTEGDRWIEVAVQDPGVGFNPRTVDSGFGLVGMRERVELAGGDLSISSSPEAGTAVRARLPAHHRDPASAAGQAAG